MNPKEFGQTIRNYRLEANMQQKDLAEKVFVSEKTISSWECGRAYPPIEFIQQLSDIFEVDLFSYLNKEDIGKAHRNQPIACKILSFIFIAISIALSFVPIYSRTLLNLFNYPLGFSFGIAFLSLLVALVIISIFSIFYDGKIVIAKNVLVIIFLTVYLILFLISGLTSYLTVISLFIGFTIDYLSKPYSNYRSRIFDSITFMYLCGGFTLSLWSLINFLSSHYLALCITTIISAVIIPLVAVYFMFKSKVILRNACLIISIAIIAFNLFFAFFSLTSYQNYIVVPTIIVLVLGSIMALFVVIFRPYK